MRSCFSDGICWCFGGGRNGLASRACDSLRHYNFDIDLARH